MAIEQLTIDGETVVLTPDGVMKVTRQVMHDKPMTYKSHRLLMIEVAKAWGLNWKELPRAQRHVLERLFDISPDIERCARKVREEDDSMRPAPPVVEQQNKPLDEDPFDAVDKAMKKKEAQRRYWRR